MIDKVAAARESSAEDYISIQLIAYRVLRDTKMEKEFAVALSVYVQRFKLHPKSSIRIVDQSC